MQALLFRIPIGPQDGVLITYLFSATCKRLITVKAPRRQLLYCLNITKKSTFPNKNETKNPLKRAGKTLLL